MSTPVHELFERPLSVVNLGLASFAVARPTRRC